MITGVHPRLSSFELVTPVDSSDSYLSFPYVLGAVPGSEGCPTACHGVLVDKELAEN